MPDESAISIEVRWWSAAAGGMRIAACSRGKSADRHEGQESTRSRPLKTGVNVHRPEE